MGVRIGVIGGSGLYSIEGSRVLEEREIPTPWGLPSDPIALVEMAGHTIAFLPRHGKGHRYLPSEVPSRANLWALKSLGVEQIVSVSAVGSLSERIAPGQFVLCDNLIDKTVGRPKSFFGDGVVGHVAFADPFCAGARDAIAKVLAAKGQACHPSGTYVCMEGPAFSTRAESELHRSWGSALIGMTALPEARLAREAEICYAMIAMVTDFDCWRPNEGSVTVEMVVSTIRKNTAAIQEALPDICSALALRGDCACRHAAEGAIMTHPSVIPHDTRRKLSLFYGRFWKD